jgi:hypothetical protein
VWLILIVITVSVALFFRNKKTLRLLVLSVSRKVPLRFTITVRFTMQHVLTQLLKWLLNQYVQLQWIARLTLNSSIWDSYTEMFHYAVLKSISLIMVPLSSLQYQCVYLLLKRILEVNMMLMKHLTRHWIIIIKLCVARVLDSFYRQVIWPY